MSLRLERDGIFKDIVIPRQMKVDAAGPMSLEWNIALDFEPLECVAAEYL